MSEYSNLEALLHPTSITKELADENTKRSERHARHLRRLEIQGQQWLDAKAKSDPIKMLEKFAGTFQSVASAAAQFAPDQEERANTVSQEIETYKGKYKPGEKDLSFDEAYEKIVRWKLNKGALNENYEEFNRILKNFDPDVREAVKNLHGWRLAKSKEYIAGHISSTLPTKWANVMNPENNDPESLRIRTEVKGYAENSKGLEAYKRRWASSQFGDEFLDKGLLMNHAAKNINTWLESDTIKGKHGITKHILAKKTEDFANNVGLSLSNDDASVAAENIETQIKVIAGNIGKDKPQIEWSDSGGTFEGEFVEGITPKSSEFEIARKIVKQRLESLANEGYLSSAELAHLNTAGAIQSPVGDKIENLYKDDEWNELMQTAKIGDSIRTSVALAQRDAKFESITQQTIADMTNSYNRDTLQNTINSLKAQGADAKYTRPLELMLNNTQSPAEGAKIERQFDKEAKLGFNVFGLSDAQMKKKLEDIAHVPTREKFLKIFNRNKEIKDELNFDNIIQGKISERIKYSGQVTLNKVTDDFEGEAAYVETELNNLANQLLHQGIENGLTGNDLMVFVERELEREWTTNGGGQQGNDKTGKYSIDGDGKYSNHKKYRDRLVDIKKDANAKLNPTNKKKWDNIYTEAQKKYETQEEMLNEAGALLTAEDYSGMQQTGQYSAKLKYLASELNVTPGQLYVKQLSALLNNPNYAEEVAKFNLAEVDINPTEVELFNALADDPEAVRLLKKKGIDGLSQTQQIRVSMLLALKSQQSLDPGEPLELNEVEETPTDTQEQEQGEVQTDLPVITEENYKGLIPAGGLEDKSQEEIYKILKSGQPLEDLLDPETIKELLKKFKLK